MQKQTSIRINTTLYEMLRSMAKQDGRTITYLLNEAVRRLIARPGQGKQP